MIYKAEILESSLSYLAYRELIDSLLLEQKTTGNDHSSAMINYTKMNVQRMKRLDKTIIINEKIKERLLKLDDEYVFLVLTEAWCGDASQTLPIINKIGEFSNGKISVRFILRDQHLNIIDAHLTNGGRAIPKLLVLNKDLEEIVSWGPRPKVLQDLVMQWKADPELTHEDWVEKIHAWYAKDKTSETQNDLEELLQKLN